MASRGSVSEAEMEVERPKRGPKRTPSWEGTLGQLRQLSPREAVSQTLLDLIRNGELKSGMRLPSEVELAQMTGISRWSVREAVRGLQAMGILEIRRGQGTFVREIDTGSVVDAQLLLLLDHQTVLDNLVEVRSAIDPMIARLAAERATDSDILALHQAQSEMTAAREDRPAWRSAHLAFHTALAQATHNVILMKVWSLLLPFLRDSPLATAVLSPTPLDSHDRLFEAIVARDVDAASRTMDQHVEQMQHWVNERRSN